MLGDAHFTDFTITCGGYSFKAHWIILASESDFFKIACGGKFIEAQTATIDLPEDEPCIIGRLLLLTYTADYPITKLAAVFPKQPQFETVTDHYNLVGDKDQDWRKELELHTLMYMAGRKFGMGALCEMSRNRFLRAEYGEVKVNRLPSGTGSVPHVFNDYDAKICRSVYGTTPPTDRGLRNIVVFDMQIRQL